MFSLSEANTPYSYDRARRGISEATGAEHGEKSPVRQGNSPEASVYPGLGEPGIWAAVPFVIDGAFGRREPISESAEEGRTPPLILLTGNGVRLVAGRWWVSLSFASSLDILARARYRRVGNHSGSIHRPSQASRGGDGDGFLVDIEPDVVIFLPGVLGYSLVVG